MKNKAKELQIFTPSLSIGVLLTLIVVGTYFNEPDMVIKEIAAGGGKETQDIYQAIRTIAGGE